MRSKILGWVVPAVVVLAAAATEAPAQTGAPGTDIQQCRGFIAPDQRVRACTSLLEGGGLTAAESALGHYFRGFARHDLGQEDLALADFDAAIGLDATIWPAYWARAVLRGARRDYTKAAEDWSEVIRHYPRIVAAYSSRAEVLDDSGRGSEALADYSKAIELAGAKDNLAQLHIDRAIAYENERQYDKAMADFNDGIDRGNHNARAYAARGRVEFLHGDNAAALADFTKAAEIDQQDDYVLLWLYLAEAHAGGSDAMAQLRQRARQRDLQAWPGPIVRAVLGELKPEQVVPPPQPRAWPEAARRAGAQCELSFYLGEQKLLQHERERATQLFRGAIATGVTEYIEYRAAGYELQRLSR